MTHDTNRIPIGKGEGGSAQSAPHMLILDGRKRLEITGVRDVIRFDDLSMELSTVLGDLIVDGTSLRIEVFDTERGLITLSGEIRGIDYCDPGRDEGKRRGFFGKR